MKYNNLIHSNRHFIAVLTGVILIVIGGSYYLKHLDNERMLEKERDMRVEYKQWHLPEGAKARIGSGTIRSMQYSPDGNLLAVVSDIGVWILNALTAEPQHLLAAHTGVINSISFSPDGSTLAVVGDNGTAQFWNSSTGELQNTFTRQEYSSGVNEVFFMPDGHALVVSSHSTKLDLWNVNTGQRNTTLSADENGTTKKYPNNIPDMYWNLHGYHTFFSGDGKTVTSYMGDNTFSFWDIATRKEIRTLKVESKGEKMSFSSDLRTLAIASDSYKGPRHSRIWEINLWDVNTQTHKKIIETDDFSGIPFLVFSSDGNFLTSYVDEAIRIWDVNTGKEKKRFKGHKNTVTTVAFSPDNRTLVSSSYDDTLRFWDVSTGKEKKIVTGYGALFWNVSLSPDAQMLTSLVLGSSTVRLWNANTGLHENNFIGHRKGVWRAILSPDGSTLVSGSVLNNTFYLWDVNTGKHSLIKGPRRHVSGVAFSRDSQTLASWGLSTKRKYVIHLYDADTGDIQRTLLLTDQEDFSSTEDLYFDNKMFAAIEKFFDPDLFVWNLVTGDYNITNLGDTDIGVAKFSPDGRVIAIVFGRFNEQSKKIVLRDVETGDHIRTLIGHTDEVKCLAFSPDSRTLASGSGSIMREKTILLWDIETGNSRDVTDPKWADSYQKYNAIVPSVLAFSQDGQTLASGMKLGDIHLWETATGAKKNTLHGHSLRIANIFFSTDGQTLISVSDDGTMLIWDLTLP